ncbi:MAG: helix-turn-helix domain-containing protein [Planctomycetota bacterium]
MAAYLSLEDAAQQLGIPAEKLIDLRSQGQIRGFRDGSSWKFPESEIDRLKDELPNLSGFGSGILGSNDTGSKLGAVIGGDEGDPADGGSGSDIELGQEALASGSDVNLVASEGTDSDVAVVAGSSGGKGDSNAPLSIDLDELELSGSAISHDSGILGAADESLGGADAPRPMDGSEYRDQAAKEAMDAREAKELELGSSLDLTGSDASQSAIGSSSSLESLEIASDSGSALSGMTDDSDAEIDLGGISGDDNASSLELMDSIDLSGEASGVEKSAATSDVLSELDLLAGEASGSGLLAGESGSLLGSSLVSASSGGSSGVDDALADDDDLIIADDDDDLVVSSVGSDISIAGDSGINLMSPSDSGLSLESEPLDLAGSSISALDLGAELGDGSGTGSGLASGSGLVPGDASGSAVDFQADEEFRLSASGVSLEGAEESGSQVIAIEESGAVEAEAVDFGSDADFGGGGFDDAVEVADEAGLDDPMAMDGGGLDDGGLDGSMSESGSIQPAGAAMAFEVPFTLLQTVSLLLILVVLSLAGMLMTDLVRNMWAYSETSAPVSGLTDALIDLMGWGR